jgi:hypothetical protein
LLLEHVNKWLEQWLSTSLHEPNHVCRAYNYISAYYKRSRSQHFSSKYAVWDSRRQFGISKLKLEQIRGLTGIRLSVLSNTISTKADTTECPAPSWKWLLVKYETTVTYSNYLDCLNKEDAYMEKSTPIFTPQILKHVTQDKSYSWSNKHGQIKRIVSYRSSMNYLTASHV